MEPKVFLLCCLLYGVRLCHGKPFDDSSKMASDENISPEYHHPPPINVYLSFFSKYVHDHSIEPPLESRISSSEKEETQRQGDESRIIFNEQDEEKLVEHSDAAGPGESESQNGDASNNGDKSKAKSVPIEEVIDVRSLPDKELTRHGLMADGSTEYIKENDEKSGVRSLTPVTQIDDEEENSPRKTRSSTELESSNPTVNERMKDLMIKDIILFAVKTAIDNMIKEALKIDTLPIGGIPEGDISLSDDVEVKTADEGVNKQKRSADNEDSDVKTDIKALNIPSLVTSIIQSGFRIADGQHSSQNRKERSTDNNYTFFEDVYRYLLEKGILDRTIRDEVSKDLIRQELKIKGTDGLLYDATEKHDEEINKSKRSVDDEDSRAEPGRNASETSSMVNSAIQDSFRLAGDQCPCQKRKERSADKNYKFKEEVFQDLLERGVLDETIKDAVSEDLVRQELKIEGTDGLLYDALEKHDQEFNKTKRSVEDSNSKPDSQASSIPSLVTSIIQDSFRLAGGERLRQNRKERSVDKNYIFKEEVFEDLLEKKVLDTIIKDAVSEDLVRQELKIEGIDGLLYDALEKRDQEFNKTKRSVEDSNSKPDSQASSIPSLVTSIIQDSFRLAGGERLRQNRKERSVDKNYVFKEEIFEDLLEKKVLDTIIKDAVSEDLIRQELKIEGTDGILYNAVEKHDEEINKPKISINNEDSRAEPGRKASEISSMVNSTIQDSFRLAGVQSCRFPCQKRKERSADKNYKFKEEVFQDLLERGVLDETIKDAVSEDLVRQELKIEGTDGLLYDALEKRDQEFNKTKRSVEDSNSKPDSQASSIPSLVTSIIQDSFRLAGGQRPWQNRKERSVDKNYIFKEEVFEDLLEKKVLDTIIKDAVSEDLIRQELKIEGTDGILYNAVEKHDEEINKLKISIDNEDSRADPGRKASEISSMVNSTIQDSFRLAGVQSCRFPCQKRKERSADKNYKFKEEVFQNLLNEGVLHTIIKDAVSEDLIRQELKIEGTDGLLYDAVEKRDEEGKKSKRSIDNEYSRAEAGRRASEILSMVSSAIQDSSRLAGGQSPSQEKKKRSAGDDYLFKEDVLQDLLNKGDLDTIIKDSVTEDIINQELKTAGTEGMLYGAVIKREDNCFCLVSGQCHCQKRKEISSGNNYLFKEEVLEDSLNKGVLDTIIKDSVLEDIIQQKLKIAGTEGSSYDAVKCDKEVDKSKRSSIGDEQIVTITSMVKSVIETSPASKNPWQTGRPVNKKYDFLRKIFDELITEGYFDDILNEESLGEVESLAEVAGLDKSCGESQAGAAKPLGPCSKRLKD